MATTKSSEKIGLVMGVGCQKEVKEKKIRAKKTRRSEAQAASREELRRGSGNGQDLDGRRSGFHFLQGFRADELEQLILIPRLTGSLSQNTAVAKTGQASTVFLAFINDRGTDYGFFRFQHPGTRFQFFAFRLERSESFKLVACQGHSVTFEKSLRRFCFRLRFNQNRLCWDAGLSVT
jgi:hypothetical protein